MVDLTPILATDSGYKLENLELCLTSFTGFTRSRGEAMKNIYKFTGCINCQAAKAVILVLPADSCLRMNKEENKA